MPADGPLADLARTVASGDARAGYPPPPFRTMW